MTDAASGSTPPEWEERVDTPGATVPEALEDEWSALPPPPDAPVAESSDVQPPPRRRNKVLIVGVLVAVAALAVVLIVVVGGDKKSAAEKVCDRLGADGVTVAEGAGILTNAVDAGTSITEIRAKCGGLVDAVLNGYGVGSLKENVTVRIDSCTSDSIKGTVTNKNSFETVDVTLRYELLTSSGLRVDDGLVFVDSLDAGQTASYDEPLFEEDYDRCHIEIESVRES